MISLANLQTITCDPPLTIVPPPAATNTNLNTQKYLLEKYIVEMINCVTRSPVRREIINPTSSLSEKYLLKKISSHLLTLESKEVIATTISH